MTKKITGTISVDLTIEDDSVVEPPPVEPPPVEPPPVEPPPIDGSEYDGNTHFAALLDDPGLHASFALKSQDEINQYTTGSLSPGEDNPRIQSDPSMNAAKVSIVAGRASIDVAEQLRMPFEAIDKATGHDEISMQWEVRFADNYLDIARHGVHTQKAFSIYKAGSKRSNLRIRLSSTDATAVALPTVTPTYTIELAKGFLTDPLRTLNVAGNYYDWQPGGDTVAKNNHTYSATDHMSGDPDTGAFVIRSNVWIRYTVSMTFRNGKQYFRLWLSDEQTPPIQVIADPSDMTKGVLTDYTPDLSGSDQFAFEFGSSQTGTTNGPMDAWVRNVAVFKNETVPLLLGT